VVGGKTTCASQNTTGAGKRSRGKIRGGQLLVEGRKKNRVRTHNGLKRNGNARRRKDREKKKRTPVWEKKREEGGPGLERREKGSEGRAGKHPAKERGQGVRMADKNNKVKKPKVRQKRRQDSTELGGEKSGEPAVRHYLGGGKEIESWSSY